MRHEILLITVDGWAVLILQRLGRHKGTQAIINTR